MNDQPSAGDFIQASRVLRLSSPLGEDVLLPERAAIEEGVSTLFRIEVAVRAKRGDVRADELIGRLADLSLEVNEGEDDEDAMRRPFNGLVTELHEGPPVTRGLRAYTLVMRPQLWLLSRRSDCRIWMDKTSLDIVQELLSEHGLPAPDRSGVITPPPAQHYSVQWNETDLAYLTRRFEEDGLFFWFSHEEGAHRLHVADSASAWTGPSPSAQGEGRVRLAQGSTDRNHIMDWKRRYAYVPGQRAGADWNFETPKMVPSAATPSLVQMPDAGKRELYEYPARIATVEAAERAEKLRMQSSEADHDHVFGESTVRILEAGRRFTPYEVAHPDDAYEEHVVVAIRHTAVDRSYETNADLLEYHNTFEAIPSRVPLTPHRVTTRPRIEGTQVALVAGPAGEEIHPDQYGRVKLWFPWDRRAKKDGSDTCWVRVAQNWAGGGWGGQIIPRIGMEVMVAFIDGDPDRPLITGLVPNPDNSVPYELPANKTKSTFRTNTHKGTGFNELTFEDENGREEIYVHAQKDRNEKVRNNHTERIDNNWMQSVGANKFSEIFNNAEEHVGGNKTVIVGQPALSRVVHSTIRGFWKGLGEIGTMTSIRNILTPGEGSMSTFVAKNYNVTVGMVKSVMAGVSYIINAGNSVSISAQNIVDVSSGKFLKIDGDHHVGITSGTHLTVSCGGARFEMASDGTIYVRGRQIVFEMEEGFEVISGGDIAETAKGEMTVQASKIKLN